MIDKIISHYRILEKLGEGGMGVVYKAQDTKLDRIVALKFLPKHLLCDHEAKARFAQEARAASALNHTNITTIYEIDEIEDECFIAMECVEGKSIKKLIEEKTLSLKEVIDIAIQVCEGLVVAHEKGIVHRDIKSDNIMLTTRGQVKIMDFGLAKLRGVSKVTKTSSTLGTVAYMSPEQARGEEVDARADIWSLGVVMYEMITGRLPFKSEYEQALVYSILHEEPQSVISLRADTPLQFERIIKKALEKDRTRRYQSIVEITPELKRVKAPGIQLPREEKSIVVLPFENLSPDPDQEYFSDGLTEEVISDLSNVRILRVISRSSAMTFKGTKKKIPEIARELDVQYVLEGSVRKVGNNLRITAQLIDAESDAHIWAEKYSGTLDDVFDVQEKVSRSIVDTLKLKLTPEEKQRMAERPIDNIAAYECYLRARQEINRFTEDALNRAIQNLQNGIDIIGDNALLYSGMALAYWQYANIGVKQEEYIAKAEEYVQKALALDPDFPQAHVVIGRIYTDFRGNPQEAILHYRKALAVNPNEPAALTRLAYTYISNIGKPSGAFPLLERMKQVDPLSSSIYQLQGFLYFYNGQYGSALEMCRKYYQSDPLNAFAQFLYGSILAYNQKIDEAFSIIDQSAKATPNNALTKLGLLLKYGLLKDKEKAFQEMTPDFQKACKMGPLFSCRVAARLALLDAKKEALDWLENSVNQGFINFWAFERDPFLENIRGEERFKKLMERVKYEWEHFEV